MLGSYMQSNINQSHHKTCIRCGEIKLPHDFYKHPKMIGGRDSKCKACARKASAERQARIEADPEMKVKEMRRQREKARKYRAEGKASVFGGKHKIDPSKRNANVIVGNAIRSGNLKRERCCICGMTAQAHHEDYSKPLEVVWLCVTHHNARHTYIRENEILGRKPESFAKWAKNPRETADI